LLATRVTAIVSDPSAPSHLFASTDGTGVFQSLDSGRSWSAHIWPTPWDWALGLALDAQSGRIFVPTESNGLRSIQIDSP
jgi:hypothetical protein